ncbi:MAG: hypothetical protein EAZ20_01755, partial [Bacteroidetes bacterium]
MNTLKKTLIPPFLKKIDRYLLENYPIIWETKLHFVLFYSLIIGNLVLLGVSFLLPLSKKELIEFDYLIENNHTWVGLSAGLSLIVYGYLQNISTIKIYTIKENLLRLGIHFLIICSFLTNLLAIPLSSFAQADKLYSKKEIEKDILDLNKMELIADFIKKIYFLSDANDYFEKLKKSHFNKNNEVDEILATFKKLENLTQGLEGVRLRQFKKDLDVKIKDNDEFKNIVKRYIINNFDNRQKDTLYGVSLESFDDINILPLITKYKNILMKYPITKEIQHYNYNRHNEVGESKKYSYSELENNKKGLKNLSNFVDLSIEYRDIRLINIYWFYKNPTKNNTQNVVSEEDIDTFFEYLRDFENSKEYIYAEDKFKKESSAFKSNILNENSFEKAIIHNIKAEKTTTNNYIEGIIITLFFMLSGATFLSVSKFFTFRNLFVSAAGGILSITLFFVSVWGLIRLGFNVDKVFHPAYVINTVQIGVSIVPLVFLGYLYWKKIHIQWLNIGNIFLINLMFFVLFIKTISLGSVLRNNGLYDIQILTMPLFLAAIFV